MELRSHCPINFTLEHVGDKWSLLIMRDLLFKGKRHYNEFLDAGENVSTSVLRDRLRMLEETGFITKGQDTVKKSRIRYSLTQKGISLLPLLIEMIVWGAQNDPETESPPEFTELARTDREGLISNIRQKLERDHLTESPSQD